MPEDGILYIARDWQVKVSLLLMSPGYELAEYLSFPSISKEFFSSA
jgi:hypothetical protein